MAATISTRSEFVDAVRRQLHRALSEGEREITCVDLDFAEWPFNEPPLLDALTQWAQPHRKLVLLAQHYDEVRRRHPRFVQWRATWGHVVEAWSPSESDAADLPGLLLAGRHTLQLLDRLHWRAIETDDAADALRCREQLDVILQRSTPAFAATTLGL